MLRNLAKIPLVLCLTLLPVAVQAVGPDQEAQAEALVVQAKSLYQAGKFEDAAHVYMQAYGHVPRPATVFNAARAYEQAGLYAEAKPLFELYLQINHGTDADSLAGIADAKKHLDAVNNHLAEAQKHVDPPVKAADPLPTKPLPPPVNLQDPPPQDPPRELPPLQTAPQVQKPQAQQANDDWSGRKTAAVVTVSAGGALILTSVILAIVAHSQLSDLDARLAQDQVQNNQNLTLHGDVTQREMDDGIRSYNRAQIAAGILGGVGALAVVTGAVLLAAEDNPQARTAMQPALQPGVQMANGGALWTLSGRF